MVGFAGFYVCLFVCSFLIFSLIFFCCFGGFWGVTGFFLYNNKDFEINMKPSHYFGQFCSQSLCSS